MKSSLTWLLFLVSGSLIGACGSSNDSSGPNSNCSSAQHMGSDAPECRSCVEQHCSSEYSAFCSANCNTDSTSSACDKADQDISMCVFSHCLAQCDKTSSGGSGGTSGTSTGGSDLGSAGTLSAGGSDLGSGGEPSTGGSASSGSTTASSCYVPDTHNCTAFMVPASERDAIDKQCTDQGGVAADTCPTKNLVGCCALTGGVETCGYDGDMSPVKQDDCNQSGGTWRTKP
jgi:hypothetical protein